MKAIHIEGTVTDANTGTPVKDILVQLILDREVVIHYRTGVDGRFLLKTGKGRPGEYILSASDSEGHERYPEKRESFLIDTVPFASSIDINMY